MEEKSILKVSQAGTKAPMINKDLLSTIGNTPLVKLSKISAELGFSVYAKLESFNPGLSAKDRIANFILSKAEEDGKLRPGMTVVEATSGNTGYAIAMICKLKGYKCILTVSDKASQEKVFNLKLMGAQVVICPSKVKPDDPRSYYERAKAFAANDPNVFYSNQNFNSDNLLAHFRTTGPEIWQQTNGNITHLVAAVGTGGTCCGTARYLKTQNPDIEIIGVDAVGSVLKKYHETGEYDPTEIQSYKMEGVGKTIIPGNVDFDIIDRMVKVTDKSAAHRARSLNALEGVFAGHSSGGVIDGIYNESEQFSPDAVVVAILGDHGSKYLSTIYNDDWMKKQNFL